MNSSTDKISTPGHLVLGNHPIFKRPGSRTSRSKFQFHSGGNAADAHIEALVVLSP
tara:strand:- start:8 stop:175 length:168 start_codon:yes stop_codon:yes gene_type:complete